MRYITYKCLTKLKVMASCWPIRTQNLLNPALSQGQLYNNGADIYSQYVYPDRKAMKTGSSFSSSQRVLQRSMFRKAFPFILLQFSFS